MLNLYSAPCSGGETFSLYTDFFFHISSNSNSFFFLFWFWMLLLFTMRGKKKKSTTDTGLELLQKWKSMFYLPKIWYCDISTIQKVNVICASLDTSHVSRQQCEEGAASRKQRENWGLKSVASGDYCNEWVQAWGWGAQSGNEVMEKEFRAGRE